MQKAKQLPADVVSQAIATLSEGICKMTFDDDVRYRGLETGDAIPWNHLHAIRQEFQNAKARINKEIDQVLLRISTKINRASSIQRLPAEVFMMILHEFKPVRRPPSKSYDTNLFDLLLVCRSWNDLIMDSPQLWCYLDSRMPHRIAQLALDRSKPHKLNIAWDKDAAKGDSWDNAVALKKLFVNNLDRIRGMEIETTEVEASEHRRLLEGPTPQLERLRVTVVHDRRIMLIMDDTLESFKVSDGPPLKYLDLDGVQTTLHSPRFSGLLTLILTGCAVPNSPKRLFHALSVLKRLEVLWLYGISNWEVRNTRPSSYSPVTLPRLKRLSIWDIRAEWTALILANLYTPFCSDVQVNDIYTEEYHQPELAEPFDATLWRPGNSQAAVLLGAAGPVPLCAELWFWVCSDEILIRSHENTPAQEPSNMVKSRDTTPSPGRMELMFNRTDSEGLFTKIVTVVSQLASFSSISLVMSAGFDDDLPVSMPDLLLLSEHLVFIDLTGAGQCRPCLQQLAQRHRTNGSTEEDWVCRKLSALSLEYEDHDKEDSVMDSSALLTLVRRRWLGGGDVETALQPQTFHLYCPKQKFPRIWSLETEIRRMVPSFELAG
ncbi:hypothetical protein FRB90_011458 [Tulasnella sp. 427]|nr:hypothetical protein FRB90_011458 [Tulasnella sp. 427]